MRLKKRRILVASIVITGSISVGLIKLHIYAESAGSVINPTASSRSGDRGEISDSSEFGDVIDDRREYRMVLSILRYTPLSSLSSPL